jgi:FMN phosphatase YigB (HAD superfamily)
MTLRVGFDLDGVLFNFGQSVKEFLEATDRGHLWKSGPNPKPYWEWYKDWKWTTPQFLDLCHEGVDAGYIFRGNVRENAVDSVKLIKAMGFEIIVITDRSFGTTPAVSEKATLEWWAEYGFPEFDEIHFSPDKTIVHTDIFVEDKIENARRLQKAGTECWLVKRPWNDEHKYPHRIDDIKDYPEKVFNKSFQLTSI